MSDSTSSGFLAQEHVLLQFTYVNWRGDKHSYVIEPQEIELGRYDDTDGDARRLTWVMHGALVLRDGDPRMDMGTRRRTFMLDGVTDIEIVRIPTDEVWWR